MNQLSLSTFEKKLSLFIGKNNAPFEWSGFLYKNPKLKSISSISLALDLSMESVIKAIENKSSVLVCFHSPDSLQESSAFREVAKLSRNKISIYKCHLRLNFSELNGVHKVFCKILDFEAEPLTFDYQGKQVRGGAYLLKHQLTLKEILRHLKKIGARQVRIFNHTDNSRIYRKIVISSGSGVKNDLLEQISCDLVISGEAKHGSIVMARDKNITIIEIGHYYSENAPLKFISMELEKHLSIPIKYVNSPIIEISHVFNK